MGSLLFFSFCGSLALRISWWWRERTPALHDKDGDRIENDGDGIDNDGDGTEASDEDERREKGDGV